MKNRASEVADHRGSWLRFTLINITCAVGIACVVASITTLTDSAVKANKTTTPVTEGPRYLPRMPIDTSSLTMLMKTAEKWSNDATLEEVAQHWETAVDKLLAEIDQYLHSPRQDPSAREICFMQKAACYMASGNPEKAYEVVKASRDEVEYISGLLKEQFLYSLIYFQGLTSLRRGENDNCIMCRGESSCILPISGSAIHKNKSGSQMAIRHFTEYLEQFPDDLEVRWLLNLAHMTLGEYPEKVNPKYLISIDRYLNSEFDIGRFRDVGHLVGVNRFNMAGGAIMEDFDNDGLLDLALSSFDCQQPLGLFRNTGDGHFEERKEGTGTENQLGGLSCVQTDYNNDGLMDIFVPRGAWFGRPIRPSLLRNDGGFHFTDVTDEAELQHPVNSNAGMWADYDNDGWVDLFLVCERQQNRLYRNLGHGKFEEVAEKAGLLPSSGKYSKGCAWLDYDNDDFPDLFINNRDGLAELYHNERDGTFKNVTNDLGLSGPLHGFSCWSWDYNNDGWMDLFATCYARTVSDVVKGMMGMPHSMQPNKLYLNHEGRFFEDVTVAAGLDMVFATMGSNFGDFDNDGFLDMYLGTGEPNFSMLVPNRMFKNVAGVRFAEISASAGTGHLQKGHGIACGDWDRDGNVDVFADLGGSVKGDEFHNALFQNPGHDNQWLTLKLVGQKTNRAALGARIKIVTAGATPMTIHRHVTSGSSFGANPIEQTIGLGKAVRISELTVHWPTSGTTQTFRDLDVDQAIKITEFSDAIEKLDYRRIPIPNGQVAP